MIIKNVRPLIGGKLGKLSDISVAEGKILTIAPHKTGGEGIDMHGAICASGYIDIHTHGGAGHDIMEGTPTAIDAISKYHLMTGTTSYCPTTLTADIPTTLLAIKNVREYKSEDTSRRLGIHLEGPFLSPKAAGAHPQQLLQNPSIANSQWILDNIADIGRITVAPDLSGAVWLTSTMKKNNIQTSIGHDMSIDDEITACIEAGASSVTHMYNCTSRPSRRITPHKHLGLTEMGLISNKLTCEVIADDRHVPNLLFKMIYDLKGTSGICLVSDSLSVAGMGSGDFYLGSGESRQKLRVDDGVATLPDLNTYAGSVTPIADMVVNIHKNLNIPLENAISMGTLAPSRLMNLSDRGDIKISYLADLNILASDGKVLHTILGGKLIR